MYSATDGSSALSEQPPESNHVEDTTLSVSIEKIWFTAIQLGCCTLEGPQLVLVLALCLLARFSYYTSPQSEATIGCWFVRSLTFHFSHHRT